MHNSILSRAKRRYCVALVILAGALSIVTSAQQTPPAKPSVFDLPATNLKVLQIEQPQALRQIMMNYNAALGVGCVFCHDEQDFAKDLPAKDNARAMIAMVDRLNAESFNVPGNARVTCFMCHRGSRKPEGGPAGR